MIAVCIGISKKIPVFIEQSVVHPPGVNPHGFRQYSMGSGSSHSFYYFIIEHKDIPVITVKDPDHAVIKPADLVNCQYLIIQRSGQTASAGSTKIKSEEGG